MRVPELLYVIAVVSNPVGFLTRYRLFLEFCERMNANPKVRLITIEVQHGDKEFCTNSQLKYRSVDELWNKETMINLAVQHLPDDWKYMAWIDTDIEFINPEWAEDTLSQLQHYKIVQLFGEAIDLGPKYETMAVYKGFVMEYMKGDKFLCDKHYNSQWHSGYAWAITRKAYNDIGGLLDWAILGSGDRHMALAFIGKVEASLNRQLSANYKLMARVFQKRCDTHILKDIGYVPGTIYHYFHGKKADRRYGDRWQILIRNKFDPITDIKKDCYGLYQLEINDDDDRLINLRDQIRAYFRGRNEDSIDLC